MPSAKFRLKAETTEGACYVFWRLRISRETRASAIISFSN